MLIKVKVVDSGYLLNQSRKSLFNMHSNLIKYVNSTRDTIFHIKIEVEGYFVQNLDLSLFNSCPIYTQVSACYDLSDGVACLCLFQLDDWVLCRIYNKKGTLEKHNVAARKMTTHMEIEKKTEITTPATTTVSPALYNTGDMMYVDASDSVPKLHTDSSCSDHVVSTEFTCDKEVQSQPKLEEWDNSALDFPFNYMDATVDNNVNFMFGSQPQQGNYQVPQWHDMFMHLQRSL